MGQNLSSVGVYMSLDREDHFFVTALYTSGSSVGQDGWSSGQMGGLTQLRRPAHMTTIGKERGVSGPDSIL